MSPVGYDVTLNYITFHIPRVTLLDINFPGYKISIQSGLDKTNPCIQCPKSWKEEEEEVELKGASVCLSVSLYPERLCIHAAEDQPHEWRRLKPGVWVRWGEVGGSREMSGVWHVVERRGSKSKERA